jgi:hypothetical protein
MKIIINSDMNIWTPYASSTASSMLDPYITRISDSLGAKISDAAVTKILSFTRDDGADSATAMYQFWNTYLRPYVVLRIFTDMCATHGFILSATGVVSFTDRDNTSAPVSEVSRGMLVRQYTSLREDYLTRLMFYFDSVNGIFDGVTYEVNQEKYSTVKSAPIFNAIGSVNAEIVRNNKFRL